MKLFEVFGALNELQMNSKTFGKTKYPFTVGFEFEVVVPENYLTYREDFDDFVKREFGGEESEEAIYAYNALYNDVDFDAIDREAITESFYKKFPKTWKIVNDDSIDPVGVEFVSPVFGSVSEAIENLNLMVEYLTNEGYETNETTGFHINVGTFEPDDIDVLKLMLFTGERYVLELFDRIGNEYTESNLIRLYNAIDDHKGEEYKTLIKLINEIMKKHTHKFKVFNFGKLHEKYIEFRAAGGNYLEKIPDVINTLNRVLLAFDVALDPNSHRTEYLKKLAKIIDFDRDVVDKKDENSELFKRVITGMKKHGARFLGNIDQGDTLSFMDRLMFRAPTFDQWDNNFKIDVRNYVNSLEFSDNDKRQIRRHYFDRTGSDSDRTKKFVTWITPILKKKGI